MLPRVPREISRVSLGSRDPRPRARRTGRARRRRSGIHPRSQRRSRQPDGHTRSRGDRVAAGTSRTRARALPSRAVPVSRRQGTRRARGHVDAPARRRRGRRWNTTGGACRWIEGSRHRGVARRRDAAVRRFRRHPRCRLGRPISAAAVDGDAPGSGPARPGRGHGCGSLSVRRAACRGSGRPRRQRRTRR